MEKTVKTCSHFHCKTECVLYFREKGLSASYPLCKVNSGKAPRVVSCCSRATMRRPIYPEDNTSSTTLHTNGSVRYTIASHTNNLDEPKAICQHAINPLHSIPAPCKYGLQERKHDPEKQHTRVCHSASRKHNAHVISIARAKQ